MPTFAALTARLLPALAVATILPSATAGETAVFQMASNSATPTASGFDEEAVARIEPAKDKPLVLNLRDLPPHQFLKIDVLIDTNSISATSAGIVRILGAGGAAGGAGEADAEDFRDRLQVSVDGAEPAFNSSFGGFMGSAAGSSFPDAAGDFLHVPGTGSTHGPLAMQAGRGAARFAPVGEAEGLNEYHVQFVIPHTGNEAEVKFDWVKAKPGGRGGAAVVAIAGMGIGGSNSNAPFSVKSLTASVIDAPVELDAAGAATRYQALGSENPLDAMAALNDLILAGHSVLPLIGAEINRPGDPDLEKKFAEALKAMDDSSFEVRAAAAKSLSDFGADVIPLARRALAENADSLSIEVKNALEGLTDRIEKGTGAMVDQSRSNRLHRLLDTLGGDEAEKLRAVLPKRELVVSPALAPALESGNGNPGVIEMDFGGLRGVDGGGGGAVFKLEAKGVELKAGGLKVIPAVPAPAPAEDAPVEK